MMRWLKDKKKDKRSSSVGCDEDSKEDDYGFEKDKTASKSPVTKRQLPPTPLTPEERSPHIYEEIHDLQMVAGLPENGKASPQKHKKYKHSASGIGLASGNVPSSSVASSSSSSKYTRDSSNVASSSKDDSISPYMVVPVDEEVRQTPTSFHRDGTPEVHCDVIVKDTHCEILLSRKPKVSAFRIDSTGGSESNSVSSANPTIRNNTHFCSRNRRASVDVHSAGGKSGSSSGAWNSSAFSSSSTSRVNSVGTSMMSLSTLSERHPVLDENGSSGSSAKGVMTYTAASNFIARATKLAFNPLKLIDGDDTSLSNLDPFFSMMPPPPTQQQQQQQQQPQPQQSDLNDANFLTISSAQDNSDNPVVYSSIPNPGFPLLPSPSQPHSRSHVEPTTTTTMPIFNDSSSCNPVRGGYSPDKPFHAVNIIRATSPSDSSSCTYASVSFPTEPKVYNTIAPDLISQETTRELQSHTVMRHLESSVEVESETESVRYSSIHETPFRNSANVNTASVQYGDDDSVYSGVLPFRINGNNTNNNTSGFCANSHHFSQIDQNQQCMNNNLNLNQVVIRNGPIGVSTDDNNSSSNIIYSDVGNHCETNNNNTVYACIENADIDQSSLLDNVNNNNNSSINVASNDNLDTSEADVDRILYGQVANSVVLDFCTCSDDQHSTACGFLDLKPDDDTSSIATTINDARGSCTGCGRLIRQITYSESYSDETYEHVYSSRLLVRKGRRFSSPDITLSEISNSETTHGFDNVKGHECIGPMSRDDSWTARNDDVCSTFYRPMDCGCKDESSLFLNVGELKGNSSQVQPKSYTDFKSSSGGPQRQSFSSYGHASNSPNVTPDGNSNANVSLAHHRQSLPVSLPSNLIPVPGNCIPSSTVSQLQPKGSAFSNLLSKFSRPKSKHAVKNEALVENVKPPPKSEECAVNVNVENQDSDATEQIPEKNTTKLSKFFQRLSTTDPEGMEGLRGKDKKRDENSKIKGLKVDVPENGVKIPKLLRSPLETKSENLNHKDFSAFMYNNNSTSLSLSNAAKENINFRSDENAVVCHVFSTDVSRTPGRNNIINSSQSNETAVDEMSSKAAAVSSGAPDHGASSGEPSSTKPPNKTDSGDTCYEYDISTSSESEQTGYDYFLSKVKKSLNLEQEVQQIADMNALRKKMFCKKCKKNNVYSTTDNEDYESFGSDAGCQHLSTAKYGDLRKIFGDIVVDQRAAILDCLTNYAYGPFNVKCEGRENMCRECGCEIMTSDSESMTTVYSILSQQFRMTSPGTHTPSCDSDDGTMADNSCESADEEDNDVSSGYDEAVCEYPSHKVKKREKGRDKKERRVHHSAGNVVYRDQERSKKKTTGHAMHPSKRYHCELPDHPCLRGGDSEKCSVLDKRERLRSTDSHLNSSISSPQNEQNSMKKEIKSEELVVSSDIFNHSSNNNNNNNDDIYDCDQYKHDEIGNRPRPSLLATEKVIQDIYAPLPSKALSWLTARNCEPRSGASCYCARPLQSSASKLIQGPGSDKGTSVPPTATADNGDTKKNGGMSHAGHTTTTDNGLNSVQTHCECSLIQDQTDSCATRAKDDHNKSPVLRPGHLNSDKLLSMNEVEKLEFNSAPCHFECSIEKGGRHTDLSHKSSEQALHRNEKPCLYSKCGIDSVGKESYLSVETSHHVPARLAPPGLEPKDSSGVDAKDKRNQDYDDIVHEKKQLEMQSLVPEVDVNQLKRQDGLMSRQKQKQLQMAALDLLPETALGGDTDMASECARPEVKAKSQRVKSNMVERLAKLFEDNDSSLVTKDNKNDVLFNESEERVISITMATTTTNATTSHTVNISKNVNMEATTSAAITTTNANNNNSTSNSSNKFKTNTIVTSTTTTPSTAAGNKVHGVTKFIDNNSNVKSYISTSSSPPSSSSATDPTPTTPPAVGVNQGQKRGSFSHAGPIVKTPLHPPGSADHPVSPIYQGRSSLDKNNDQGGKSLDLNINAPETSSKLPGPLKKTQGLTSAKSKSDKRKEAKDETSDEKKDEKGRAWKDERRSESRARKQQILSPSPSSSSGSSSKRRSHTRPKKLSKRGHLHKRARSKSERRKNHHEERTLYYFSSDISDIDIIEVKDWETYSSARSRDKSKTSRDSAKPEVGGRAFEKGGKSRKAQDSPAGQGEECVIQEIYSIPPNSSDIRGVAAAARTEGGSPSPQPGTPELAKANKSKKTDIYKTKKNNNKLLSDLIIRNYDRQMYDVGSSV